MGMLRHMAMITENNRRLARFYHFVFGMAEVWNRYQNNPHAYYIGDGYFQLNCLNLYTDLAYENYGRKNAAGKWHLPDPEIHHVGFLVKSMKDVEKRFTDLDMRINLELSPRDGRYEECRFTDPDGNYFELAQGRGWDAGEKRDGMMPACYVGIDSGDPDRLAQFYKSALDMKEVNRTDASGPRTVYLSDGAVCFAISGEKGRKNKLTSLGFKVPSIADIRERLKNQSSFMYPGETPLEIQQRPASSPYKAYFMKDPDGNTVEMSEEGWI